MLHAPRVPLRDDRPEAHANAISVSRCSSGALEAEQGSTLRRHRADDPIFPLTIAAVTAPSSVRCLGARP